MGAQVQDKVYWHAAFFEALQLELHQYLDSLTFLEEHPLSKEALIIDVLVIKKARGAKIKKNFGDVFLGHNLFEFKSENDSLTVRDYNKVMGYAYLYASFTPAEVSDITVSFAVTKHPRELLAHLKNERLLDIIDTKDGIYRIEGETFPIQILEIKKMPKRENLFLKSLRSSLDAEDAKEIAEAYKGLKPFERRNVYLDRLFQANRDAFREAIIMSEATKEIILEVAEEQGWLTEIFLKKKKEAIREIAKGFKQDNVSMHIIEKNTGFTVREIETL